MTQEKEKGFPGQSPNTGPEISVVVPLYNEAENVLPLHSAIVNSLEMLSREYEIIYVDDGSTDGTSQILLKLTKLTPRVRVVKLMKNFGQTPALSAGFDVARGEIIVSLDGDLQNDPVDIPRLLAKLEKGYDVVCGWRRRRKDAWLLRLIPSRVANWIIAKITGVDIHDTGCTLKAYRGWVVRTISLYSEMHRYIPALAAGLGARVTEIEVRHHRRQFGISKYGLSRAYRVLLDLLVVKMLGNFVAHPIRWFAIISLPIFLTGVVFFVLGLVMFSFKGKTDFGLLEKWDLGYMTCSIVLVMTASNLFLLGFLSELAVKTSGFFKRKSWPSEEGK